MASAEQRVNTSSYVIPASAKTVIWQTMLTELLNQSD
jgi:hypothetical protein